MNAQAKQIALPIEGHEPSAEAAALRVPANELAHRLIEQPSNWLNNVAIIYGPEASGKSRLLAAFAAQQGTSVLKPNALYRNFAGEALVLDGLEQVAGDKELETALFHLINRAILGELKILISAGRPMGSLDFLIPDLRSRVAGSSSAIIEEPDTQTLRLLLLKHFAERQIDVKMPVIDFVVGRIERSYQSVARAAAVMDAIALVEGRAITVPLAKEALEL